MKHLLLLLGAVFSLNLLSITTVRTIGDSLPTPDLLLAAENCSQPCWHGLQPGIHTEQDFTRIASMVTFYRASAIFSQNIISEIRLDMRGNTLLGDVMVALGEPTHVQLHYVAGNPTAGRRGGRQVYIGATLYFGEGLIRVDTVRLDDNWLISADMIVRRIHYFAPHDSIPIIPFGIPRWHGFGRDYPRPIT